MLRCFCVGVILSFFEHYMTGHNPKLELIGISTVAGNQTVDKTTENAVRVLDASGLSHIEVARGQAKPLLQPPLHCPSIHGESGLDGPFGRPALPPARHAVVLQGPAPLHMFEKIKNCYRVCGQRVALVATAALTNVALLLTLYPEVLHMINIVIMGGCLGVGNTGPVVEFNMQCDPHSAYIVFESGADVTLCPLEVTHTALATPDILQRIRLISSHSHHRPFLDAIASILTYFAQTYKKVFKFEHPPLHDPVAVAYVIDPDLFETENLRVDIEISSTLSSGQVGQ